MEKSKVIFNNVQPDSVYRKAVKSKAKYARKFGDDSGKNYSARVVGNEYIGDILGVKNIAVGDIEDGSSQGFDQDKGIIVGNIRMGFGHYRISMAIASAANSMGYVPYWMDLNSYKQTTCTKVISAQNDLYSKGSRISQRSKLFNKIVWEPLNYEGFRKLSYNSADQKNAELMAPVFANVPKDIPVVATHVWPAQAAIHAGMENVVNAIPDNWPMALHFAEGSIHTVQTHYAYQGYRICNGMDGKKVHLVEMRDTLAPDCNIRHRPILMKQVEQYTTAHTGYQGLRVTEEGLVCRNSEGEEVLVPGKTIICAVGQRSNRAAVDALRYSAPWVREIGDCARVSNITSAVYQGYHAALDI